MVTKKKTTKKVTSKKAKEEKPEEQVLEAKQATTTALEAAPEAQAPPLPVSETKLALLEAELSKVRCISCGAYLRTGDGSVKFQCPNCAVRVGRCVNCRALGRMYTCSCGFVGP